MKKTIVLVLALTLVVGSMLAPAGAAKKKKKRISRTVELSYDAPALGVAPPGNGVCLRPTNSCGDIPTGPKDKFIKVEIADATGTPVAFSLTQDTDPDAVGSESDLGDFCGTTGDDSVAIEPGYQVIVFPWAVGVECAALASSGTVTATISNLP